MLSAHDQKILTEFASKIRDPFPHASIWAFGSRAKGSQSFERYQANPLISSAVERQFITIGKALNQAIKRSPDLNEQISDARKIVDFRNLLTHSYGAVSDAVVWDIFQTSLPRLTTEVDQLLGETL